MRVGLIGFGKTGKAVASVLLHDKSMDLRWVLRRSNRLEHRSVPEFLGVDSTEPGLIYSIEEFAAGELLDREPVDVIIDFSAEDGLDYYATAAAQREVAIVSAVSKYSYAKQQQLLKVAELTRVIWSPNITVGINFLLLAAQTLRKIAPTVDIQILEEHFREKPEVSGTALRIAQQLGLEEFDVKTIRAGGIIGNHEILFGFPYQTVRLRHESITREAFGNGAIFAAKELSKKPIGLYSMEDLMLPYFSEKDLGNPIPLGRSNWLRRGTSLLLRRVAHLVDPFKS
jgi:4-hydroxy-tetrahydrodipicolinate reductase